MPDIILESQIIDTMGDTCLETQQNVEVRGIIFPGVTPNLSYSIELVIFIPKSLVTACVDGEFLPTRTILSTILYDPVN